MIRFACGTCGKSLRAPESLAGKRGRCAHCSAVNRVPAGAGAAGTQVVPVEVKRSTAQSPFRSTADIAVRDTLQGTVALSEPRVLSDRPIQAAGMPPQDFFDQVAMRLGDLDEPLPPDRPAHPRPRGWWDDDEHLAVGLPASRVSPGAGAAMGPTARRAEAGGAVAAALAIGGVVGFCAGVIVARWAL